MEPELLTQKLQPLSDSRRALEVPGSMFPCWLVSQLKLTQRMVGVGHRGRKLQCFLFLDASVQVLLTLAGVPDLIPRGGGHTRDEETGSNFESEDVDGFGSGDESEVQVSRGPSD